MTKKDYLRKHIAVFHKVGGRWVVVRGIYGTEKLGDFRTQKEAQECCLAHNLKLEEEIQGRSFPSDQP